MIFLQNFTHFVVVAFVVVLRLLFFKREVLWLHSKFPNWEKIWIACVPTSFLLGCWLNPVLRVGAKCYSLSPALVSSQLSFLQICWTVTEFSGSCSLHHDTGNWRSKFGSLRQQKLRGGWQKWKGRQHRNNSHVSERGLHSFLVGTNLFLWVNGQKVGES